MRFPTHNRPRTAAPLKGEPPLGEVQFFLSVQHHRLILVRLHTHDAVSLNHRR